MSQTDDRLLNLITCKKEYIDDMFIKKYPELKKFLVVLPNAGSHIPCRYLNNVDFENISLIDDVDYNIEEIFDLVDIGGTILSSVISRDFVDLDRRKKDSSDDGIVKKVSVDGTMTIKKLYDFFREYRPMVGTYYEPFHKLIHKEIKELKQNCKNSFLFINGMSTHYLPEPYRSADICIGTAGKKSANQNEINFFQTTLARYACHMDAEVICDSIDAPVGHKGLIYKYRTIDKRDGTLITLKENNCFLVAINRKLYLNPDFSPREEMIEKLKEMMQITVNDYIQEFLQ